MSATVARSRRRTVALLGALLMALLTACGGTSESNETVPNETVGNDDLSRAKQYSSLDEIRRAATVVAVVRTEDSQSIEMVGRVPFTVTAVTVLTPVGGSAEVGTTLLIRQTGAGESFTSTPLLSPGTEYLLFLKPFTFMDGDSTGQWVVIGVNDGMYEKLGEGDFARTSDNTALPSQIASGDVAALTPGS